MDPNAVEISNPNGSKTQGVTFKPDGCYLVSAESSGNLRRWKIGKGEEIGMAMKAKGSVYAAVASTDGRWIVSSDSGKKVIVWDAVTHEMALEVSEHTSYVYAVDVSNDCTRIASGSADYTVRVFDITSGVRIFPPLQHNAAIVVAVKFSPDGHKIATATYQNTYIYDAHSGERLFDISIQATKTPTTPLAWSSDSVRLFISTPGKITFFDTTTSFRSEWSIQNSEKNTCIATHGQFIACAAGSSVSFWDYDSREQIGSIVGHETIVNCVSVSRDGRFLACGRDKGITVHDLRAFLPSAYRVSRVPLMQLSDPTLVSWMLGNPTETERMLSEEIDQSSQPSIYAFAARSLIRARLREWSIAIEDAEKSLQIKHSPIGQVAMSLALVGAGKQEVALDDFDIVFLNADPNDTILLLVIKAILAFTCGRHKQAVSRLRRLIASTNEKAKGHYIQVLGSMYLKLGEYGSAVQTLEHTETPPTPHDFDPLISISLIFGWKFDGLKVTAWQRLCETLYTSGRVKEVGETLLRMADPLDEDEKEPAHGRILENIVTRSGQVRLLAWTGKPSKCNSCLPSSPDVYSQDPFISPHLQRDELEKWTDESRVVFPLAEALVIYDRLTRSQSVRFTHFRLHLPCLVFGVKRLRKEQDSVYCAETKGIGEVEFTTADALPLKAPQRLVFADTRIHGLDKSDAPVWEDRSVLDAESDSDWEIGADIDAQPLHGPIIEEVPTTSLDAYTRALQLIAHLGQPFSALLLSRQPDGAYKRVAAEHEIVVRWTGSNVAKDVRVEVLEIV